MNSKVILFCFAYNMHVLIALSSNPLALNGSWFFNCPSSGKLRFDFMSIKKPRQGINAMGSVRFEATLKRLDLEILRKDETWLLSDEAQALVDPSLTYLFLKDAYMEYIASSHHYHTIYPEEKMKDLNRVTVGLSEEESRPKTPEILMEIEPPLLTKFPSVFALGYQKLLLLQITLPLLYLSVQQTVQILSYFSEIAYLRVQAFVSMFSRIVDYDKCGNDILRIFSDDELREVFHRMGILNVIDPMFPDRLYRLDLRRYDHR